jgi:putative transposase
MILVQKNKLKLNNNDKFIVDRLSYHSARLYNSCIYNIRQHYFNNNSFLPFKEQYHQITNDENFSILINDSSQQVLRMVEKNFKSFFSLLKLKQKGKYSNSVKIPNYLNKEDGWSIFIQGRSARIKGNKIHIGLTKKFKELYNINQKELILDFPTNLNVKKLQQVQIKPLYGGKEYEIMFCYEKENDNKKLNQNNYLSIDCGLDNLLTTFDTVNQKSIIISGKQLKSVNQHYNKTKAKLQSTYEINKLKDKNTKKFIKLSEYRKNYINNYFNQTVNKIVKYCLENNIGNIVIGDFKGIKQEINIGKKNNQNFVSVPYGILKRKLEAKCNYYGIKYILQEESYTSKCSALDLEPICKKEIYMGKRIHRGLYKTFNGNLINADVNGAINILRKYIKSKSGSDLSDTDVSGAINHPVRVNPTKTTLI